MKNIHRMFTAQELFDFIMGYKLACFRAPRSGNAWIHANVQTDLFTLVNCEDYPIIRYKMNPPGCVDGSIALAGNAFAYDYKDYGWSVEGVLSSEQIRGRVALTLYHKV